MTSIIGRCLSQTIICRPCQSPPGGLKTLTQRLLYARPIRAYIIMNLHKKKILLKKTQTKDKQNRFVLHEIRSKFSLHIKTQPAEAAAFYTETSTYFEKCLSTKTLYLVFHENLKYSASKANINLSSH